MLRNLSVRNYVLIDSLEVEFPEGLIIITGQTGAGKSILLGALSLLMGAKADASLIGGSADNCVVEAVFDTRGNSELCRLLEENEVEQDEGLLTVRRVLARSGRSRSFINDCPVSLQLLSQISSHLIDIHSQHQTLLLTDRRFQLSVLDAYAGNASLLSACAEAFHRVNALKSELSQLENRIASLEKERDFNEAQFRQLDAAKLRDGELQELESEQKQLANAEEIKEGLCQLESLFTPSQDELMSIDASLRESERLLSKLSNYIPKAEELSARVNSARLELDDIKEELEALNSGFELSGDRLQMVEDRLSLLYELMKKHACRDIAGLIEIRDRYSAMLFDSSSLELRRDALLKELNLAEGTLAGISADLHRSRTEAAKSFGNAVCDSLHFLELERAVFELKLEDVPVSASGTDAVTFLFSATGGTAVDAAKCASGGELSRIMLSLKALMAKFTSMPTMIFDEIDTGVSGSVADRMGSMICSMGENMQVFAITHLPQVAAKGKAHFLVEKGSDIRSGRTVSTIHRLSDEERVHELARMLSGATVSAAAIANARELLSLPSDTLF